MHVIPLYILLKSAIRNMHIIPRYIHTYIHTFEGTCCMFECTHVVLYIYFLLQLIPVAPWFYQLEITFHSRHFWLHQICIQFWIPLIILNSAVPLTFKQFQKKIKTISHELMPSKYWCMYVWMCSVRRLCYLIGNPNGNQSEPCTFRLTKNIIFAKKRWLASPPPRFFTL